MRARKKGAKKAMTTKLVSIRMDFITTYFGLGNMPASSARGTS